MTLTVLFCLCFSGIAGADFRRDYVQAKKSLTKQDWNKAAEKLRSAIADNAQESESERLTSTGFGPYLPYFYLGQALQGMGDCAGAAEAFQTSVQQGVVQALSNEYAQLQAGMQACGTAAIDVSRIASQASGSIEALGAASDAYAALADDPGLAVEWARDWKQARDTAEREVSSLQSRLQAAEVEKDADAIEAITAEAGQARDNLLAVHASATERVRVLDTQRSQAAATERNAQLARDAQRKQEEEAEAARLAEERRKQNAVDEAKRLAAIQEREEAQRQAREQRELLQRRESIASAQRELRTELNSTVQLLQQTSGDDTVTRARSDLARVAQSSQAMVSSEVVADLNRQTQAVRDGIRKYQQVSQEWEAGQREIARRTPPPDLQQLADAYFAGDYELASRLADPAKFSEQRQKIQAYLFRSAALFNQYWLAGANDDEMLQKARADIAEIKRLNSDFSPYVAAFSPKYLEFYKGA